MEAIYRAAWRSLSCAQAPLWTVEQNEVQTCTQVTRVQTQESTDHGKTHDQDVKGA